MTYAAFMAAFSMGLLGSLHCAGMCGPIMLILPFQMMKGWRKWTGISIYHLSRIVIYSLMGLVLFSFKSFFHPQWQQYVSISLGILLLLSGIGSFYSNQLQTKLPWIGFVKRSASKFIGRPGWAALSVSGMLNGLLPCGLVYMALAMSANADNVIGAMGTMFFFGLGTAPMLVSIILLKRHIRLAQVQKIKQAVPIILLLFGSLFVLRGMNLGIPYLSPKVAISAGTVESNCCHSPDHNP